MLTLNTLRQNIAIGGWLKAQAKRVIAAIAAIAVLLIAYDNRQGIVGFFRSPTTGMIYVDSPEIYTRERLVNDRFVQDAWLRAQLDKLSDMTLVPAVATKATDDSTVGTPPGTKPPAASVDVAKIETAISPSSRFRIQNAVRELIRQEIVENQLDDRHDLGGNTIFMLKFDAAIVPGDNTSASAVIDITVGPKAEYPELRNAGNSSGLPPFVNSYFSERFTSSLHTDMRNEFIEWTDTLTQLINERIRKINQTFWNSKDLDGEFENFIRESGSGFSSEFREASTTEALQNSADAVKAGITPQTFASVAPYVAMFALRKAVEEIIASPLTAVRFSRSPQSLSINMNADWPLVANVTPASIRGLPPIARVSTRDLTVGFAPDNCFNAYEERARIVAAREKLTPLSQVLTTISVFSGDNGERNRLFSMGPETQMENSDDWIRRQLDGIGKLIARRKTATGNSSPQLSSTYIASLVQAFVEAHSADGAPAGEEQQKAIQDLYGRLILDFPSDERCPLDVFVVPVSYFRFLDRLLKQQPFSYAVLPKFDADVESVEAVTSRQIELSSLLSQITSGVLPADIGVQLVRESATRQSRANTRLIGYGSSSGGDEPNFGWVISPGTTVSGSNASQLLEAQQKSLAALISFPAWWREVDVEVRTGWMDRDKQEVQWVSCDIRTQDVAPSEQHKTVEASPCRYHVRLPRDPFLLDDIVLRQEVRQPRIRLPDGYSREISLQKCAPAAIEIPGLRLWRSTVVTLSGQRARSIVVLPDMHGIIAEFDPIQLPEGAARLTVWTSEGNAEFPVDIRITDERADKTAACPQLKVTTP